MSALTAKAKLAGMWRDKVDQHNTGSAAYERIERIIIERPSAEERLLPAIEAEPDFEEQPATSNPSKHWCRRSNDAGRGCSTRSPALLVQ